MRIQWHQIILRQLKRLFLSLLASLIIQIDDLQCPERCDFVMLGNAASELMKIQPFTFYPRLPVVGRKHPGHWDLLFVSGTSASGFKQQPLR